ncbi:MAG: hypothetical protein JWO86_6416 [Myxococcaceae bacterium]|nr:hypothetical protein [Myxococcaceae bacterium]
MSLSTLIVQREIASIREVEEALARQVLYGGDLITNLLEVCKLDEAQLLPIVAESLGLPPAPPGELPRAEPDAMRLVAAEVAVERNLAPLTVDRYGLTVAVAEPLSADVEQELSFALALPISQKIAPLVRIKQALARDYGVPLDRRLQRLLQRMMTDGPRGSSFPPMRNADIRLGAPRPPSFAPAAPHSKPPEPVRPSMPPGGGARTLVRQTELPPMRTLRRRRGAITVDVARAELEEATERDTIFDLLFEFARQYFDYTAVFIVHGEIAEGRDAFGDGAARDKVARIGVPLDLPSILSAARESKKMLQRVPAAEGLDAVLMADLGRSGKTTCVVLPVVVRTRVVAMLLGDGGETGIEASTLADVEGIVVQATAAFERLIVRRKLKGSVLPPGMGDSLPPVARASMAPPTKLSQVSDRPSVEELAPPIRDLMTEPMSRVGETVREPVVQAILPPETVSSPRGKTDQPPPPPHLLEVRRPSGRPIPREEPASRTRMPAVTAPSNLGGAAQAAILAIGGTPASGTPRSRGRRGEAPKLDFGAVPPASSVFSSEAFGSDDVERKLLAEIHGQRIEHEPPTARDKNPPVISPSNVPPPVSSDPEPPPSPKAESPPPMPVAAAHHPITDMSPVAFPAQDDEEITQLSAQSAPIPSSPPPSAEMISAEDADVHVVESPISSSLHSEKPATPWPSSMDSADAQAAPSPRMPAMPESSTRPMPASEQQISVALHRPPSSRSDHSRILPSVIVDVASEYVGLVDRVVAAVNGPAGTADDAETELLRAGGYAMPAIMERFPGPVTIERHLLADGPMPRVAECGPVLRLVASQRRTALPFVLSHVEDPEVEKRFWATYLLTELVYPDTLDPIIARVFDEEPRVRRAARAAARAFAEAHPAIIVERLEHVAMDGGENRDRRALAIDALGETREAQAVPALMRLLGDPDSEIASAVRGALTSITRQDFGPKTEKWQAWWEANRERHRLEWLIDALMHDQAALRAAAGEELKTITKEYFGYYDDLPKRERERAQSRYREWWNSIGRVRFSRASSSRS